MEKLTIKAFDAYPPLNASDVDALLAKEIAADDHKIVVLDDDPTGVQTVHDVTVFTNWDLDSLRRGFAEKDRKVFYLMTNSRGMTAEETTRVHREIGKNVAAVAKETGKKYLYMSRSDSTLRGHYPLETLLLKDALEAPAGKKADGEILCPFFLEGGRFTLGNVHYVKVGADLIPAAQTEFAKDKTFGYTQSALPAYVEEKTEGAYKAADVVCIPLERIRALDLDGIERLLLGVHDFGKVCVNAIDYTDIKVVSIAIYRAMAKGKTFLFRTAAGLVKVMSGVSDRPLLSREEMIVKSTDNGGLVVVGSHTQKTTAQLNELLTLPNVVPIAMNSDLVLEGEEALAEEGKRCLFEETEAIRSGKTAVCYTKRSLLSLPDDTKESALLRSLQISAAVESLVGGLSVEPAFIVAKGGITSSDIGVKALRVKSANVMGQISPGIPVWQTGAESLFPQIPYVIFPGNVGEVTTLREVVEKLTQA